MNRWKYALVGLLVGAFAFPLVWNSDPLVIGQTVTVDSTQSPLVVNAVADLADLTPTDGQSVIIKTGTEKGLWYYDKDSSTATSVSVLNGPGSVGRFLVINNDAGSVAAATAITAAEITDDGLLELQAFDGSSAKSLTLEELKKTGVQAANAGQYGAVGNGSTDDLVALQAWLDAYDAGARLFTLEPNKTYIVSARLIMDQMDDCVIDLNGSTIKCSASSLVDATGKALQISRSSRWELRNGVLDGNRDNRGAAAQVPAHNLGIYDCDDFVVYRILSKNARVDGFYLDEYSQGTASTSNYRGSFVSCKADNCTRQGMSIISGHDIRVRDSSFVNTNGLSPGAGIDVEADAGNSDPSNTNILIDGCYFNGNFGNGLQLSSTSVARDILVRGCLFEGSLALPEQAISEIAVACTVANTLDAVGHGLANGTQVAFRSTGTILTGLSADVNYYVINTAADTFQVALTPGGSAVAITNGSGTGVHYVFQFAVSEIAVACTVANTLDAVGHGLSNGQGIAFRTSGTLPTGLTAGSTTYYVINSAADTFQVSTTVGGAAASITNGTGSGVHYAGVGGETLRCSAPATIIGNYFRNIVTSRGVIDVGSDGLGKVLISGNKFFCCSPRYTSSSCVYTHGSSGGHTIVTGNYSERCPWFAYLDSDYAIVSDNIVNIATQSYGGLAVIGSAAYGTKVQDNLIKQARLNAIFVTSSANNTQGTITGNTILNTTGVGGNLTYGTIRVLSDSYLIANNVMHLDTAIASSTAIALLSADTIVDANRCTGYSTTSPIVSSAGEVTLVTKSNYPQSVVTAASLDATPSVIGMHYLVTANAGATTITAFDDGVAGQTLFLLINDTNTTIDFTGTTLKGNAGSDWSPTTGDHLTAVFNGTNWYCTISDNTP